MTKYFKSWGGLTCPICSDKKGNCKISSENYLCLCSGKPDAKIGEVIDLWMCLSKEDEGLFLWENHRLVIRFIVNQTLDQANPDALNCLDEQDGGKP
jgi:hypothetical protein